MKPWEEGDGAVEKFILIKITEQDDGSGFPVLSCAASPCGTELWDGILGTGAVTTVPCAPGAIPNQIPLCGMEPLCQR